MKSRRPKTRTLLAEVPTCCGALYGTPSEGATAQKLGVGYILMDKPISGAVRVCEGLWYVPNVETWEHPGGNWGKCPNQFLAYPHWAGDLPYVRKIEYVWAVGLLCNFPHLPYDIRPIIIHNVKSGQSQDLITILNYTQATFYEDLLLELGFSVVNRTINPRHDSKIVLYHRSPKELKIEA